VSILNRQDKMSMAASIESRVPFMDYRLVEFANGLPAEYKLRNGSGKAIVKDVARRVLPARIVDRRKSGFGVPLDRWFRASDGMGEQVATLPDRAGADVFGPRASRADRRGAPNGCARPFRAALDGPQSQYLARDVPVLAVLGGGGKRRALDREQDSAVCGFESLPTER